MDFPKRTVTKGWHFPLGLWVLRTGNPSLCLAVALGQVPEPPPIHVSVTMHKAQRTCHLNHMAMEESHRYLGKESWGKVHKYRHSHTDFIQFKGSEKGKVFFSIVVSCLYPPWSKNNFRPRSQKIAVNGRGSWEVKVWGGNLDFQSLVKITWTSSVPKLMGKVWLHQYLDNLFLYYSNQSPNKRLWFQVPPPFFQ